MCYVSDFVPDDFVVPRELVGEGFRLEPLGPQHNEGDYRAWLDLALYEAVSAWLRSAWPFTAVR